MMIFKKHVAACALGITLFTLAGCDVDYVDETYRPAPPPVTVTSGSMSTSNAYYGSPPSPATEMPFHRHHRHSDSSASYGPPPSPPVVVTQDSPSSAHYGLPPSSPPPTQDSSSSAHYGPPPATPEPASTSGASYGSPPVTADASAPSPTSNSGASYGPPPPPASPSATVAKAPDDKSSAPVVAVTAEPNKDDASQASGSGAVYGG